jgi:hypothetical protein
LQASGNPHAPVFREPTCTAIDRSLSPEPFQHDFAGSTLTL